MEKESSPQISGDMVSLYNMVSPQNGDTRGGLPPPPTLATPLLYYWYVYKYLATGKYNVIKTKLCFAGDRDSRGKLQRLHHPSFFTSHCEAFFTLKSTKNL